MLRRAFLLLSFACVAAGVAWAADDPMIGDWKLNLQKSRLVDEMMVASLGGNKYSFDFGGGSAETIVADGTDQPGIVGTTFAVTPEGPEEWTVVRKRDGRLLIRATWTLGKDGSTLQDDYTQMGDNGKTTHVVYLYERRGEGTGFAGDWVSTSEQMETSYEMQVRPYEGDGLTIVVASEGVTKNVKFDGKAYLNPGSRRNVMSSARRVNERTIELTDKIGENLVGTQEISISEDGKMLTMTMHRPGRSEPNVLVFDRE
ncbi:MAG TPA: hypothetical protein VKT75_16205 [Acidobacteriaceae bacterium]|nr:hypothetical protein [Acidobacteriaceae bacterium]